RPRTRAGRRDRLRPADRWWVRTSAPIRRPSRRPSGWGWWPHRVNAYPLARSVDDPGTISSTAVHALREALPRDWPAESRHVRWRAMAAAAVDAPRPARD